MKKSKENSVKPKDFMPTYQEILKLNEKYAMDNDKEPTAIKRLMMHHAALSATAFYQHQNEEMSKESYQAFLKDVDAYIKKNTPVQHLIGHEYFYGYCFTVNKDVLIPRYETEELVTNVLDYMDSFFEDRPLNVVDIGTGSGCIAISLKKERPSLNVYASDISDKALKVATLNAEKLEVDVDFKLGDMTAPFAGERFDVIVSNPPYLKTGEEVEALVLDNEPHVALFGGDDGLKYYRRLFEEAPDILNPRFFIALEHGFDSAKAIRKLAKKLLPGTEIIQKKDMQGKDRMTFIVKK
jgi:release factor glutamine methyltransferase